MLTERENSLKDYYKILGLEEGASLEEITARWLEFKKQFQLNPERHNGTDKRIKEINEAYRILKASVPLANEFDLKNLLKEGALARKAQIKAAKRKIVILSFSIFAICLLSGAAFFFLTRWPGTVWFPSTTQSDPTQIAGESMEKPAVLPPLESKTPVVIAKIAPQEPSKTTISEGAPPVPISKESPAASSLKTTPPVEVARVVPREPSKATNPESSKPAPAMLPALKPAAPVEVTKKVAPQEPGRKVFPEVASPVLPTSPALKPAPPVEVAKVVPQEQSKKVVSEAPRPAPPVLKPAPPVEVARIAPQEPSKAVLPESPKPVPVSKESPGASVPSPAPSALKPGPPVEVARVVPQEPAKMAAPEAARLAPVAAPALTPRPPAEVTKVGPQEPVKTAVPEAAKPAAVAPPALKSGPPAEVAKVAPQESSKTTVPLLPSGPPSEGEVRQFLERYISNYNNKSTGGLISFFSPKAIQNQKDDLDKIRKTYDNFFDQMEAVEYQIAINKIEPQQNSVEVRGQYQLEGVALKGRKKYNWKGQIRWVLVRENGALKILSLDYQPQK